MNFWQKLPQPFLALAPMEDVTDFVFREIVAELGAPQVMFTEFTNVDGLTSAGRDETSKRLKFSEQQRPVVAQLWGSDPDKFSQSAKLVKKLGFDGLDINMGCPDRAVIKKGAGSALIKTPHLAEKIIKSCQKSASPLPISVKTRLGWNKFDLNWFEFLLKQNLSAISIHGHTVKKGYTGLALRVGGRADWSKIQKIVKLRNQLAPKTLIIGNGDIASQKQAIACTQKYQTDGVMIGRAALKNPWIFSGKKPTKKDRLNLVLKHARLFEKTWINTKNFATMYKFFNAYISGFKNAKVLRMKLMKTKNYHQIFNQIKSEAIVK